MSAWRQYLPALLVLSGVVLVGTGFYVEPRPGQEYREYHVDQTNVAERQEEVLDYDELSPEGQRALKAAIDAPDDRATVYGESNFASEFPYDGVAEVVHYDGNRYSVFTYAPDGLQLFMSTLIFAAIAVPGLVLIAGGGLIWWRRRSSKGDVG